MSDAPFTDETGSPTPDAGLAELVRFQRDLYLYWRAVRDLGLLPLTSRGYVTRPALRRVIAALGPEATLAKSDIQEYDDQRLLFIRRLLQRLGLLRPEGESAADDAGAVSRTLRDASRVRIVASASDLAIRYFSRTLDDRLRLCLRVWVAGGWWPDQLDERAPPPRLLAPLPPRVAVARRRLLDALARQEPGQALILPSPDHKASRPAYSARKNGRKQAIAAIPDMDHVAVAACSGPLRWLGLVVPAEGTVPAAPQPRTGVPAVAQRQGGIALFETPGRVVLLPDFSVVAYPPLTAPELVRLDAFAEHMTIDQVANYRVTRQSVARALRHGMTMGSIERALEELTHASLPQNVRASLLDWERQGERVRLTTGRDVLRVEDASLLKQLLGDEATACWIERQITPTAALITPGCATQVRAWLLRRGVLPAMPQREQSDESSQS